MLRIASHQINANQENDESDEAEYDRPPQRTSGKRNDWGGDYDGEYHKETDEC